MRSELRLFRKSDGVDISDPLKPKVPCSSCVVSAARFHSCVCASQTVAAGYNMVLSDASILVAGAAVPTHSDQVIN